MGRQHSGAASDEEVQALDALDSHLSSGDEWDLVTVEPEDLGFPASMSAYEIEYWSYGGGLEEVDRTLNSDDATVIEYTFALQLGIRATMALPDLDPAWEVIARCRDEAQVRAVLDMEGRVGLRLGSREDDRGYLEYISVSRADGTKGYPFAAGGEVLATNGPEGARIIPFPPAGRPQG